MRIRDFNRAVAGAPEEGFVFVVGGGGAGQWFPVVSVEVDDIGDIVIEVGPPSA